ncbi:CCA tRNA nucleotidyltransferase [Candidatus Sneabacter namystus]|uniref:CCA tRNA nucleotidyltransferase n=1 Tax=Candidatus Sneabacter namystus TaxID=2601646 RepID=UPI00155A8EE4|nr:CCA tRNA nucleotidyltransferase [Candidatus Sneabacter namystus]
MKPLVIKQKLHFKNRLIKDVIGFLSIGLPNTLWPRLIGGCVRDAILQHEPNDIDIATPLTPDEVISILEKEKVKIIPQTGTKFGTVKVVFKGEIFDITTLREDIKCYGRHADVKFTTSFEKDAFRRDFTINALGYCFIQNEIYDYVNGIQHLRQKKVQFIGAPEDRIQEDYLRIMRFFRFSARYATSLDVSGYTNCVKYANKLSLISNERVIQELDGLLNLCNVKILNKMHEGKILQTIFADLNIEISNLSRLEECRTYLKLPQSSLSLRYSSLFMHNPVKNVIQVLKKKSFSKARIAKISHLMSYIIDTQTADLLWYDHTNCFTEHVIIGYVRRDLTLNNAAILLQQFINKPKPMLPITGKDITDLGILPGKEIKRLLDISKKVWIKSAFKMSKKDILQYIIKTAHKN